MINAPNAVKNALLSGNFKYANLVEINLGDAYATGSDLILYYTDYVSSITHNGKTYTPNHSLTTLDGISRKASVGSDQIELAFTVADEVIVEAIHSERYINKPTIIERVVVENNAVLDNFSIPVRTAWGLAHKIEGSGEDRVCTLVIDSVLGDLDGDNGWFAINSSHQRRFPNDQIMKWGSTVMTEEQQKRYTTNFNGVINQSVKPPALPVIYGERNASLIPILQLKHRKSHSTYRHYFTTWVYVVSIGDIVSADINNIKKEDEKFDYRHVNNDDRDVGGWSLRLMTPAENEAPIKTNTTKLNFWLEAMDTNELNRLNGMFGKGLTLLFVKNRNRDDWLSSPPELTMPVKGIRLYDPRTGQTTTTASRNPALQYADFLRSTDYGAGQRNISVSDANIITLANHFDNLPESVGNPGINDIKFDVQMDTGSPLVDNMNIWMESLRLYTSDYYGEFIVNVQTIQPSVWDIDEYDNQVMGAAEFESGDFTDRINQLTYSIKQLVPDTSDGAEAGDVVEVDVEATFPADGSELYNTWLSEDSNIQNFKSESLEYVTSLEQAFYWTMVDSRISRQPRTLTLPVGAYGWLIEVGDVITYTSDILEEVAGEWRVDEVIEDEDGNVELMCIAYASEFYSPDPAAIPDPVANATPPVKGLLPTITNFSLIFEEGQNKLTWDKLDSSEVAWYSIEVWNSLDTVQILEIPKVLEPPLSLGTLGVGSYKGYITAFAPGIESNQKVQLSFNITGVVEPTVDFIVSNFEIVVNPSYVNQSAETLFEIEYSLDPTFITDVINLGSHSGSITIAGLLSNTIYYVRVRVLVPAGVSNWTTTQITTLNDGAIYNNLDNFGSGLQSEIDSAQAAIDALGEEVDINLSVTTTAINKIETLAERDRFQINTAIQNTESADLELLRGLTNDAQSREVLRLQSGEQQSLIDASVFIDPNTGQIINKAFSYSEGLFTQAELRIDGVEGEINAAVERIEVTETGITGLSSQLSLVPAQITATATAIVSESIAALEPAFTFNFFDSTQGWTAANGTITSETNQVAVTWGDIENTNLGYDSTENKLIRVVIERTGGSGWSGNIVITRDNSTTETFNGIINEPPLSGASVLLIDFSGLANYSGIITGVRITLGASTSDTFDITSITIGKADATTQDLQNITARVTQAELDIDANEGQITQRVTITDYNNNTVTFSNVETTVDGLNSIITLEATRQSLIDNNTIANANTALIEIDALEGTITALGETVSTNQQTNETTFNQVQTELDSVEGRITNNTFGIITEGKDNELAGLVGLLGDIDIAKIRKLEVDKNLIFADAVQQLNVDVGPTGALSQSILNLTAVVKENDVQIVATADRVTEAEADILGNASSIDQLELDVSDLESGLGASLLRIDEVEILADGTATAISTVEGQVNNPELNSSALYTFSQSVESKADGNTTAITNLGNRVDNNEDFAASQLILNSDYDAELDLLTARAFLGVDINNRVTGINIAGEPENTVIDFIGDKIRFIRPNDLTAAFEWDDVNDTFVFDGKIIATDSTFTGTVTGSNIVGGTITGGAINGGTITGTTGSFSGSIFAENIEGDVTDAIVKTTIERTWDGVGDPPRIAEITSVTVAAMPFDRFITCGRIEYNKIGIQNPVVELGGIVSKTTITQSYAPSSTQRYGITLTPPIALIPANSSGVVTISVGEQNTFDTFYKCPSQELIISVFKQGGSLS